MNINGWHQITHRRFERLVPQPMLDRANVEPLAEHPCRAGGTKSLKIELRWIEARSLRDGLTAIERMLLAISGGRGKHNLAVRPPVCLKFNDQVCWRGNLALFPAFGIDASVGFGRLPAVSTTQN